MGDNEQIFERRYLTTAEAAEYCGYKTPGALRKAKLEGRIKPAGRRGGGNGAMSWSVDDLDAFMRGEAPRREVNVNGHLGNAVEVRDEQGSGVARSVEAKGRRVYVRGQPKDPRTGKKREVNLPLKDVTNAREALNILHQEMDKVRQGVVEQPAQAMRFKDFAVSLLERKIQDAEIKSAKNRVTWGEYPHAPPVSLFR